MSEFSPFSIEPDKNLASIVGEAREVSDEQIPEGYSLFRRDVRLLNGNWEPAFYSTREDLPVIPDADEKIAPSIIEGFAWALQVADFQDHETADDDRTQEIGNMMSYAMTQGLTERQVLECYQAGFVAARDAQKMRARQN